MKRLPIAALAVFALTILPFVRAGSFGYIGIDDSLYFVTPEIVTNGLTLAGLKWAFTDLTNGIWMPATWLVYQFDYSLRDLLLEIVPSCDGFQLAYSIAHVQAVLLHGVNAMLACLLLCRLDRHRRVLAPTLAALFWSVHPLRVESVVWIASLKDVLSMTFLLAALIAWVRQYEGSRFGWYAAAHVFLALGCCAKPSVMTFPGMVFLLDALVLGTFVPQPFDWRRYRRYLPSLAIVLPVALLAQRAQTIGGATQFQAGVPLWYRLVNAVTSIGVYFRNLVWPLELAPQCELQWPNLPHFLVGGLLLGGAAVGIGVWVFWRSFVRPGARRTTGDLASAGLLWSLGTLVPMLGLSAFGGHAYADRFTYIPFLGVSIVLLSVCSLAWTKWAVVGLVTVAGCVSFRQTGFWRDDGTLMSRILAVDGDRNFLAHQTLGLHLFEHRRTPQDVQAAERHFSKAYALKPQICQSLALAYLVILGESGRAERMPEVEARFVQWLHERQNAWNSMDQDIAFGLVNLYREGSDDEVANGRRQARAVAQDLMSRGAIRAYQPYWFIYLAGKRLGDEKMRRYGLRALRRLADPRGGFDYSVRFRFLAREP